MVFVFAANVHSCLPDLVQSMDCCSNCESMHLTENSWNVVVCKYLCAYMCIVPCMGYVTLTREVSNNYASVGGALEAYGSRRVCL